MIKNIYCLYDKKAEVFKNPFMMNRDGEAVRAFSDLVNRDNNEVSNHPEDYGLYKLGEFQEIQGRYTNIEPLPKLIIEGSEVIKNKEVKI